MNPINSFETSPPYYHRGTFRRRVRLLLLTLALTASAGAVPINRIEYFFDADPGFGNGTVIAFSSRETFDTSFFAMPTGLAPGFHVLFTRACDDSGRWGIVMSRPLLVEAVSALSVPAIVAAEYYFDNDPKN